MYPKKLDCFSTGSEVIILHKFPLNLVKSSNFLKGLVIPGELTIRL